MIRVPHICSVLLNVYWMFSSCWSSNWRKRHSSYRNLLKYIYINIYHHVFIYLYTHTGLVEDFCEISPGSPSKKPQPLQQNICTCYSRYRHPGEHKFPWIDVLFYHLFPHLLRMPAHLNFQYISCVWCVHGSPSLHRSRLVLVRLFPCFSSDRYTWQNNCPNYSKCSQLCHRDNYCNEGSISAADSKVLLQLCLIVLNCPPEDSPEQLLPWGEAPPVLCPRRLC